MQENNLERVRKWDQGVQLGDCCRLALPARFLVSLPELCIGKFEIDLGVESRGYTDELAEVNIK